MGILSITDVLQLWHVAVLMAVYGAGNALFTIRLSMPWFPMWCPRTSLRRPTPWTSSCAQQRCDLSDRPWRRLAYRVAARHRPAV